MVAQRQMSELVSQDEVGKAAPFPCFCHQPLVHRQSHSVTKDNNPSFWPVVFFATRRVLINCPSSFLVAQIFPNLWHSEEVSINA
jgi:hypothetical protein